MRCTLQQLYTGCFFLSLAPLWKDYKRPKSRKVKGKRDVAIFRSVLNPSFNTTRQAGELFVKARDIYIQRV